MNSRLAQFVFLFLLGFLSNHLLVSFYEEKSGIKGILNQMNQKLDRLLSEEFENMNLDSEDEVKEIRDSDVEEEIPVVNQDSVRKIEEGEVTPIAESKNDVKEGSVVLEEAIDSSKEISKESNDSKEKKDINNSEKKIDSDAQDQNPEEEKTPENQKDAEVSSEPVEKK